MGTTNQLPHLAGKERAVQTLSISSRDFPNWVTHLLEIENPKLLQKKRGGPPSMAVSRLADRGPGQLGKRGTQARNPAQVWMDE